MFSSKTSYATIFIAYFLKKEPYKTLIFQYLYGFSFMVQMSKLKLLLSLLISSVFKFHIFVPTLSGIYFSIKLFIIILFFYRIIFKYFFIFVIHLLHIFCVFIHLIFLMVIKYISINIYCSLNVSMS